MDSSLSGTFSGGNATVTAGMAGIGGALSGLSSAAGGLVAPVIAGMDFTGTRSQISGAVNQLNNEAANNGGYQQESTNPNNYLNQSGGNGASYAYPELPGYSIPGYSTASQPSYPSYSGSAGGVPGFEGMPGWASAPGIPISWPGLGENSYVPGSEYLSYPQAGQYPGNAGYPGGSGYPGLSTGGQTPPSAPSAPSFSSVEDARSQLQGGSGDLGSVLTGAQSQYSSASQRAQQNPEATQQLANGQQKLTDARSSGQSGVSDVAQTTSGNVQDAISEASADISAGMDQINNAPMVGDEVSRALGSDGAGVALGEMDAMVAEMQSLLDGASNQTGGQQVRSGLNAGISSAFVLAGSSGPVEGMVLDGGTGADILVGGSGADTLTGGADDDLIIGRGGNDAIYGGTGSDQYLYARGDGWDTLYSADGQTGGSTTQTSFDVLMLDGGISRRDVWLWLDGNDLRVGAGAWSGNSLSVAGGVTVSAGSRDALDKIISSDGYALDASKIDQLVSAMAAFGAPGAGAITLTQQQHDAVSVVIAQSWQTAA